MPMNLTTKLVFALEHVAHLHDLIEGNEWEHHLNQSLTTFEYELKRQPNREIIALTGLKAVDAAQLLIDQGVVE